MSDHKDQAVCCCGVPGCLACAFDEAARVPNYCGTGAGAEQAIANLPLPIHHQDFEFTAARIDEERRRLAQLNEMANSESMNARLKVIDTLFAEQEGAAMGKAIDQLPPASVGCKDGLCNPVQESWRDRPRML